MKELSMEEKAKSYDEAIEKIQEIIIMDNASVTPKEIGEYLFPELKESEDDKMLREIKKYIKEQGDKPTGIPNGSVAVADMLAWIEKKGQKETDPRYENLEELLAADDIYQMAMNDDMAQEAKTKAINALSELEIGKLLGVEKKEPQVYETEDGEVITYSESDGYKVVEPKFKVGDWVVNNISKDVFLIKSVNSGYCTLEDVKGNIISPCLPPCESESHLWTIEDAKPGDVLATSSGNTFIYHKHDNNYVYYHYSINYFYTISINSSWNVLGIHPATKEQRDLLFQKMKEAGYEWDTEKREPKKKKLPKCVIDEGKSEIDYCFTKMMNGEKVSSAWSEDDEEKLNQLHKLIVEKAHRDYEIDTDDETLWGKYAILSNWLKSLKERVQPQWKPSEGHIRYLQSVINDVHNIGSESCCISLGDLLEQLKKL